MKHDWQYKKIENCFHHIKNGANIKQDRQAEGLPITRIETLANGVFNRDRLGYANVFDKNKYLDYIMEDGDLLMSHINSKQYIGRTVLYNKRGDECIIHGMNLLRLKATLDILMPKYAVIYFQSIKFKSDVAKIRKDAVNQSSMAISDLKNIPIPVPPLPTQQSIVSELDSLSQIIADCKETIKDYDALEQSIFYDMFGDPVKNEKGWEVKKVEDVYSLKAGKTIKANELSEEPSEGLYPCFGGNGIRGYIAKKSHCGSYPIIGRQGALCGNVNFAEGEFYATEHAVVVSNKIECNPLFSYFLLTNMKLERLAKGVAQPGLSVASVNEENSILPPLPLQQQFASKIEAIEQMKSETKKALQETETLFQARMDYWFN